MFAGAESVDSEARARGRVEALLRFSPHDWQQARAAAASGEAAACRLASAFEGASIGAGEEDGAVGSKRSRKRSGRV